MELITYLNNNFYTLEQLLNTTKIAEQDLREYQNQCIMPQCSYKLKINTECDSFFGMHTQTLEFEYYAKGYTSWLAIVASLRTKDKVYAQFAKRYKLAVEMLKKQGYLTNDAKLNANIDTHLADEWEHFVNGTYGLCTTSGLPEDIAAKELAILIINEFSALAELSSGQLLSLAKAVNLLDQASSQFAPHELAKSSRQRLVTDIRRKYNL